MSFKAILAQLPFGRSFYFLNYRAYSKLNSTIQKLATQSVLLIGIPPRHFLSSNVTNIPIVSYDDIKLLPQQPDKLLIDVREVQELTETGQIPTSINIPLGQVAEELSPNVDAGAFKAKYGRDKPKKVTEIIFHCKIGKRSHSAAEIARNLGYENTKNYLGSWMEWAEKEGLPK